MDTPWEGRGRSGRWEVLGAAADHTERSVTVLPSATSQIHARSSLASDKTVSVLMRLPVSRGGDTDDRR